MFEFINGSLFVAILTVLIYIAIYHHDLYKRLYLLLASTASLVGGCVLFYAVGINYAFAVLVPFIKTESLIEAQVKITALAPPFILTVLVFTGILVFLVILLKLPEILQKDGNKSPQQ